MPIAATIDWYGPVNDRRTMIAAARYRKGIKRIVYMGIRKGNIVNYFGLTSSPHFRFLGHHALFSDENVKFFIGEIVSQEAIQEGKKIAPDLDLVEKAFIFRLQPRLNTYRKLSPPNDCISIFSRFHREEDGEAVEKPLSKFPTLLAYNHWTDEWHESRS